jgi:lipopolysaccharide/colanic/teichoic acid biosynthesis glycosyltransferase
MYKNYFKRIIDFTLASVGFMFFFPIFLIVTLLLCLANSGKPFFFQVRPKKNEKLFTIIKFRTMNDKKDSAGSLLPDEQRLTKTGKLIRSLSLDELPQLINVIKGDMALVGPRPLLVHYLPLYNKRQAKRHNVRPGITRWAQVNGRNTISWQEKFELDVFYVENVSFYLDLKILFLTLKKVFIREGINALDNLSMEEFKGN